MICFDGNEYVGEVELLITDQCIEEGMKVCMRVGLDWDGLD